MKCDYHDFIIIFEDSTVMSQVCKLCGEKKRYRKINDKINNVEYLKDHIRDFAQPGGATDKVFQRFYGKK